MQTPSMRSTIDAAGTRHHTLGLTNGGGPHTTAQTVQLLRYV